MANAKVDRAVTLTGPTPPPQFTTYRPPAIEEDHSTDSTTPTYATAYHSAATGAEELSSLWGGRPSAPTPMDPAIQRLRSIANSRAGFRSPSAGSSQRIQQDLARGRDQLERLALAAERENINRLTAEANLRNEIPQSMRTEIETQITNHMRRFQNDMQTSLLDFQGKWREEVRVRDAAITRRL